MAYAVSQADLSAIVPPQFIVAALDDDNDGVADVGLWDTVSLEADRQINSRLAARFSVPLNPAPDLVIEAKKIFLAEMMYLRRGVSGDANPWTKQADGMRKRLESIGKGDEEISAGTAPVRTGGSLISEPTKLHQGNGQILL
ncbi:MAG: phage protein Gp36 family protein [Kiritimatiellia bacterium]